MEEYPSGPKKLIGLHGNNSIGGVSREKGRGSWGGLGTVLRAKDPKTCPHVLSPRRRSPSCHGSTNGCIQNHNQNWKRAVNIQLEPAGRYEGVRAAWPAGSPEYLGRAPRPTLRETPRCKTDINKEGTLGIKERKFLMHLEQGTRFRKY